MYSIVPGGDGVVIGDGQFDISLVQGDLDQVFVVRVRLVDLDDVVVAHHRYRSPEIAKYNVIEVTYYSFSNQ